jgi:nucleotide-binding universal stress UspA family protein
MGAMAPDAPATAPEIEVVGNVRPKEIEAAREKVEALRRYIGDRDIKGRVVLRRQGSPEPPRGYGPLRAVLLGGVSRRVAVAARCPVIVLPRGVSAPLEALMADEPATA